MLYETGTFTLQVFKISSFKIHEKLKLKFCCVVLINYCGKLALISWSLKCVQNLQIDDDSCNKSWHTVLPYISCIGIDIGNIGPVFDWYQIHNKMCSIAQHYILYTFWINCISCFLSSLKELVNMPTVTVVIIQLRYLPLRFWHLNVVLGIAGTAVTFSINLAENVASYWALQLEGFRALSVKTAACKNDSETRECETVKLWAIKPKQIRNMKTLWRAEGKCICVFAATSHSF